MTTKRQYRSYSNEFKEEALALISDQGYSAQEAADALGIRANLLYGWKQTQDEHVNSSVTEDERAELLSLRKEVKTLRMEKEILYVQEVR